jgi:predicted nuclease of predicted toxin-antitoxin system
MAKLYSNENFDYDVVELLRDLNHDVLTTKEAGQANLRIPDEQVLAFATAEKRAVITFNYQDFKRLHRLNPNHCGIIICTDYEDIQDFTNRIHTAIETESGQLDGKLIRINRPNPGRKD